MTARRLAALLRPTGPVGHLPDDASGWERLLATASEHRLLPALWSAVHGGGLLDEVPVALRAEAARRLGPSRQLPAVVLADAHAANARRVADLLDQATEVLEVLDRAGIAAAPLKGVDALLAGRYPDPAARTMTDVDLLVDPAGAADAFELVRELGYTVASAPPAEHHLPPLVRAGRPGSIELHRAVLHGRWATLLPPGDLLARSTPAPDAPGRRLHRDDAAAVLVAHAQLQDEGRVLLQLPMRALHETARLLSGDEPVDWTAVEAPLARAGAASALREHLHQTAVLFGDVAIPGAPWTTRARADLVIALADRPRARAGLGQIAFVPRSLSVERMVALHGGPRDGLGLWATRARHVADGARRRLAR